MNEDMPTMVLTISVVLGQPPMPGMERPVMMFVNAKGDDPEGVILAVQAVKAGVGKCENDMRVAIAERGDQKAGNA